MYIRDIMRDNMLVNLTGLEGDFMAIDLNIEHLIRFLKVCCHLSIQSYLSKPRGTALLHC